MAFDIFVNNDNTFTLPGVTNEVTGAVENGGTVVLTIVTLSGTEVSGIAWPLSMPNINTKGDYQVTVDKAMAIVSGERYRALIVLSGPGDAAWDIPFQAKTREA